MTTYRMQDGAIIKTENATGHWKEDTRWNGNNHISVATGSQWSHEELYRSKKGRFYIEHWSQMQGSLPSVEWVDDRVAVAWLMANDHEDEIPEELLPLVEEMSE